MDDVFDFTLKEGFRGRNDREEVLGLWIWTRTTHTAKVCCQRLISDILVIAYLRH